MKEKLDMLVVEDEEIAVARKASEEFRNVDFSFATTLAEAQSLLGQRGYDAIITDGHFPLDVGGNPQGEAGLAVVKRALESKTPYIVISNIHHHQSAKGDFLGLYMDMLRQENEKRGGPKWDYEYTPYQLLMPFLDPQDSFFGLCGLVIEGQYRKPGAEVLPKPWKPAIIAGTLLAATRDEGTQIRKEILEEVGGAQFRVYDEGGYQNRQEKRYFENMLTSKEEGIFPDALRRILPNYLK